MLSPSPVPVAMDNTHHPSGMPNTFQKWQAPSSTGSGRNGTRADECFAFGPDCAFKGHEEVHYAGYEPAPALTEVSSILFLCFDVERSRTGPAVRVIDFHQLVSGEQKAGQGECISQFQTQHHHPLHTSLHPPPSNSSSSLKQCPCLCACFRSVMTLL